MRRRVVRGGTGFVTVRDFVIAFSECVFVISVIRETIVVYLFV